MAFSCSVVSAVGKETSAITSASAVMFHTMKFELVTERGVTGHHRGARPRDGVARPRRCGCPPPRNSAAAPLALIPPPLARQITAAIAAHGFAGDGPAIARVL